MNRIPRVSYFRSTEESSTFREGAKEPRRRKRRRIQFSHFQYNAVLGVFFLILRMSESSRQETSPCVRSEKDCNFPNGICRDGTCFCSGDYVGPHCEHSISTVGKDDGWNVLYTPKGLTLLMFGTLVGFCTCFALSDRRVLTRLRRLFCGRKKRSSMPGMTTVRFERSSLLRDGDDDDDDNWGR